MRGGQRHSARILETMPFCWLCSATTGQRTREHVFARSLQREFPSDLSRFEPIRLTSLASGGVVGSRRGPMPGEALVAGSVCGSCNNGWMSQLESAARPYLLGHETVVKADAIAMITRWFVKTAIVINVSQPYRVLWGATRRHQAKWRVPDNVAVSLYRTPTPDLNWMQGTALSTHLVPAPMNTIAVSTLITSLTHLCRIQIGTLVGAVIAFPWQLSASTPTTPGQLMWSHGTGSEVDLSELPELALPFTDDPYFHVRPSAFWSGA